MTNQFSWTRNDPKATIWRETREGQVEGMDSCGVVSSAKADPLDLPFAGNLPKTALTIHVGGKGPEDIDHLIVRPVSYVNEANCIVLHVAGAPA
jgi:hypothetical protein